MREGAWVRRKTQKREHWAGSSIYLRSLKFTLVRGRSVHLLASRPDLRIERISAPFRAFLFFDVRSLLLTAGHQYQYQ